MRRLLVVTAVACFSVSASAQITTITPTALGPWQLTASASANPAPPAAYIAPGFDTPPLGIGSVHLTPGSDGNLSARARNTAFAGTRLDALEALSYSTYVDVDGSGGQAPYLNLLIDQDGNGTVDDQLFFEPVYQTGAYPGDPVPNQGTVTLHTWQTWNAFVGGWWSLDAATFGPPLITLSTYIASFPNATIVNTAGGLGGIQFVTGTGAGAWDNFLGAVDNVAIDTTAIAPITYNFEPAAGTVVTVTTASPDGWALQTVDDGDATNTATIDIVPGPATPPMGDGSLRLAVGADGGDAAQARSTNWDGQLLRDLSSLTYWTYVQQDGSGGQAPYIMLDVDYNNDGVRDDILFFEPLYSSAPYYPTDPQAALVVGAWQQWDARDGGWWSLNNTAGAGPGTNVKPLSAILDVEPDAKLTGANGGGVRIVAGFGAGAWDNFIGFADVFAISFTGGITTYDFEPIPSIIIGDISQNEGTGGTTNFVFNLTLSEAVSQTVTVQYTTADGTALAADGDYTPVVAPLTATFTPGNTTTTITIVVGADAKFEPNETFFVNLATPANATISDPQAQGTILNDDAVPTVSIDDVSLNEGNAGTTPFTFTITLSNPTSSNVDVTWTTTPDTATAPADFAANSGTATITAGNLTTTVTVNVVGETLLEPNEQFFVDLTGAVNATLSADDQGIGTILNDDSTPTVSIGDVSLNEGNAGTTPFTFTITLSNPTTSNVDVTWTTAPDTATSPSDFAANSGTATITAGNLTTTVTVNVGGDGVAEPNEQFFVDLTGAVNATLSADTRGIGTILNDDGVPSVSIGDVSLNEGNAGTTPFTFTITLSGPSSSNVDVTWATAPNTATSPADFATTGGTATITAGNLTTTVTVNVVGETMLEPNETFFVNLTGAVNASVSSDNQGIGTIQNDDGIPTVIISDVSLNEGNAGTTPFTFTLTLSNASSQNVDVTWATAPDTATSPADFAATGGTATITAGNLTTTVTVNVVGETLFEPNEQFFVNLTNSVNASVSDTQGAGTIINDDGMVADVSITKTGPATMRPGFPVTYTITVSNAGPQTASNVVVSDTIPAGTTFLSATPSQGTCVAGPPVSCTLGSITAGGSATITLVVDAPATEGQIVNTASVSNTPEADPNQANNVSGPVTTAVAVIAAIPTTSEWGLLALMAAMMALAVAKLR